MKKISLTIFVLVLWLTNSDAQQISNGFFNQSEAKNSLSISFDLDPSFYIGLEYDRIFDLNIKNFSRKLNAQVGVKTYGAYTDINYGVSMFALADSKWNIILNLAGETKFSSNYVNNATGFNFIFSAMPGFFKEKWYLGLELMYKNGVAQYLKHTPAYKLEQPTVQDGWYDTGLMYYYFSLNAGFRFSERTETNIRIGYRTTSDFTAYPPYIFPYFLDINFRYRF